MQLTTFKGGIHPKHNKSMTEKLPIEYLDAPDKVYIPLIQNIGAPCKSLVSKNDLVKVGQKIGEPLGFVSAPRSEEHTSELQSHYDLVCRLLLEKKK